MWMHWSTNDNTPFSLPESPSPRNASQSSSQSSLEGSQHEESALLQAATLYTISKQIAPFPALAAFPQHTGRVQGQH